MALITKKDIDDIKAALAEAAPFTEEPIVYKQFDHIEEGDPVMGTPDTPIYETIETTATVHRLTLEEVAVSAGVYLKGDIEFTVRIDRQPSYNDRIQYQGAVWNPKSIDYLYLGEVLWWEITARRE